MPLFKSAQAQPENKVIIYEEEPHSDDVVEMHQPEAFSFKFPHLPDSGTIEVSEGPASGVRQKEDGGPKDPWDWQSGGMKNFTGWLQARLESFPLPSGETTSYERAIGYAKHLDGIISKAISNDFYGPGGRPELDHKAIEQARHWLHSSAIKMKNDLDHLQDTHYGKKKSAGDEDDGIVKEANRTPYTGGIIVTVPLLISRCARVCINGTVSAGHDLPSLYAEQVKKYSLNIREQAELAQHLEDMGFQLKTDRLFLPDEEIVVQEGRGDLASNYYA